MYPADHCRSFAHDRLSGTLTGLIKYRLTDLKQILDGVEPVRGSD
jgi:hypothetical protein